LAKAASLAAWRRGWRLLGLVWALLLALLGSGAGVLAVLGPPEPPVVTAEATAPEAPATSLINGLGAIPGTPRPGGAPAAAAPGTAETAQPQAEPLPPGDTAGTPTIAADPALLEPGPHGPLPKIGPEGRTAIRAYGRAYDRADPRPRIGLVLGGVGLNAAIAEEAIRRLPQTTALAFNPYAPRLGPLLAQARARGMETLVALPLEPTNYPLDSPGERVLLTGLPTHDNLDRLEWALSRFQAYVGAIGALGPLRGERFAAVPERLGAVQDVLRMRGLLYIDPRPGAPQPVRAWGRTIDLVIDEPATRAEIEAKLATLERLARERGSAVGYAGEASPVLIDRLAAWAGQVEGRGLALAPVTALLRRPEEPPPQRSVAR